MRILAVGIALLLGYVGIYAGSVYVSKDRIAREMAAAVEAGDVPGAMQRLDMGALRSFLKSDLKRKARAVRGGKVAVHVGPPPENIDAIVDHYVQEDKIALLFALRPQVFPGAAAQDFIRKVSFKGPFSFAITVGAPIRDGGAALTLSETVSTVTFVFKATGWTWKAVEMHVPLFLVPLETMEEGEIRRLLSAPRP